MFNKNFHIIGHIILLIINYYLYNFCKLIKKNKKCLQKKKCSISNQSRRVYILKNLSFFLSIFIIINIIVPINKYIVKIPLISSLYCFIILITIIIQITFFINLLSSLKKQKCLSCLGFNNTSKKIIYSFILQQKAKVQILSILIYYIVCIYI